MLLLRFKLLLVAGLVLLTAPTAALAEAPRSNEDLPLDLPAQQPAQAADAVGSGSGSLARTFIGLMVVIALIYGLYWLLRRVKASREERSLGTGLSTEAVIPLGPNRALHLVRTGRELVLVGVAEHGVAPIRTYTEEEAQAIGLIATCDEPDDEDDAPRGRPLASVTAVDAPRKPVHQRTLRELFEGLQRRTVRS